MQVKNKVAGAKGPRVSPVVRYAPMHAQILPHLRKDIVENRWKSGERLSEPQLCKEFGVSRTPLRQALKTLEADGLIRLVPHVGAVVTVPDAGEVIETMEILIGIEQLAATRVAQSQQPEVLAEIEKIYREMHHAAEQADALRYYALNDDFHLSIVRGTGNRSLVDLHEKVMWHVHRERHRANAVEPFTVESADSHDEIVRAILDHRAEDAGLAMREHLENVSRIMLDRRLAQNTPPPAEPNLENSEAKPMLVGKIAHF
jgi:DNA-binding GntR family transcriptional regulator